MTRTALVTGGGRGIGKAAALALARSGHRVAVGARTGAEVEATVSEIRRDGGQAIGLTGDLTSADTTAHWIATVTASLGPVEVLVNNAGSAPSAKIEDTTDADLHAALAIHVVAPFRLCRAVVPGMKAARFGRIVNIASVSGISGGAYVSAYTAAKHGIVGLTRALAAELARSGITANAVCPGFVDTEMTRVSARRIAQKTGCSEAEAMARLAELNRNGRLVAPAEVARTVVFLAAEDSGGINGECLVLDGGTVLS
jgi:NAD(P)-dependent dehydrogenase (short-subunit alcohol dehydrogenase family)